ncbi:MAG: S-layer homology domain-containing protein [Oscillospiraceae bacterium]|nr:S-layer homology domain-containing protein [Oscillospiraceae bacterium]
MKKISRRLISSLSAAVLLFALLAAGPLTAYAADGPIEVTENPVGANYFLNRTAVPLKAEFRYDALAGFGTIDSVTPVTVQWYWSLTNSNTGRDNGQGEYVIPYDRQITYPTMLTPATDTAGVRYYYAVVSYAVPVATTQGQWETVPREAVTAPARIEVIATEQSFQVKKVDENNNPLAGAVFSLVPDTGHTWGEKKSYEATSRADGVATFAVTEGAYILSEKTSPTGYEASDKTHIIWVESEQVLEVVDYRTQNFKPYETITFVNTKIPASGTHNFTVKKTDDKGNPLSGATIRLEGLTENNIPRVYDVVTTGNGEAVFSAENGTYDLSEHAAPQGYNASGETYTIVVTANGVYLRSSPTRLDPYTPVTFVNKEIPSLNKDDHFAFMQGYPEGTFMPGRNMTRAEAVVMFSRLLTKSMNDATDYRSSHYPDVPNTAWYANQVGYLQLLGVLADYSRDSRFRPDDPVTRAEFATLAAHFDNLTFTDTNKFSDVPNGHWAMKYINSAAAKGWIAGYPDGTFKPEANITRAEVVTLVGRMLDRFADSAYLTANAASLPRSYSDLTSAHWAYLAIMEASMGHDYTKNSAGEHWTAVY